MTDFSFLKNSGWFSRQVDGTNEYVQTRDGIVTTLREGDDKVTCSCSYGSISTEWEVEAAGQDLTKRVFEEIDSNRGSIKDTIIDSKMKKYISVPFPVVDDLCDENTVSGKINEFLYEASLNHNSVVVSDAQFRKFKDIKLDTFACDDTAIGSVRYAGSYNRLEVYVDSRSDRYGKMCKLSNE